MSITVNVEDSIFLREPIDKARAKGRNLGKAESIERLLENRFPGEVPANLSEHLADLEAQALDQIFDRSMKAKSVENALLNHMPAAVPAITG